MGLSAREVCAERRRQRGSFPDCPARGAGVGSEQAARLAGGGRGGPGRGHPDRGRRAPGRRGGLRGQATGAGDRLPGRHLGAGAPVRRRRVVPGLRGVDGAIQRRPIPASSASQAARAGVRDRVGDHGRAQPGCHRGPAHPGGVRHRGQAGSAGQAARVRVHAPGELRLAAAARLQPDQPARVRGQRAGLRSLRRTDGGALAGRHRRRVRRVQPVLRRRSEHWRPVNMRPRRDRGRAEDDGDTRLPVFTVVVVALTLAGFAGASAAGVNPAWAAFAGAVVLATRALARRRVAPASLVRAADLPFLLFVLSLGIVVKAVTDNGLGRALAPLLPGGTSLPALLATAALAAALANVCNNLPAVLVLLPLAAPSGAGAVLAVLLGVNIGPNLTYTGSLATLLWRRILRQHGSAPDLGEFTRLGLLTVPAGLVIAVLLLWAGLRLIGG